jgi:tellurite resistance protein
MKNILITFIALLWTSLAASGQNFRSDLKKLDGQINAAYKSKKLTEVEYGKLKREQEIVKLSIDKAMADGYLSADEKNRIHSKIIRAKKRLAKYKTNREIY